MWGVILQYLGASPVCIKSWEGGEIPELTWRVTYFYALEQSHSLGPVSRLLGNVLTEVKKLDQGYWENR